jgi:hypothetical protein
LPLIVPLYKVSLPEVHVTFLLDVFWNVTAAVATGLACVPAFSFAVLPFHDRVDALTVNDHEWNSNPVEVDSETDGAEGVVPGHVELPLHAVRRLDGCQPVEIEGRRRANVDYRRCGGGARNRCHDDESRDGERPDTGRTYEALQQTLTSHCDTTSLARPLRARQHPCTWRSRAKEASH